MKRFFIELAYKGTHYHGWQVQPKAVSVQEKLNETLQKVLQEDINVVGAGRTDTGVHASFFVAHFDLSKDIEKKDELVFKMNCMLPKDIVIYRIFEADPSWHARFDATSRTYKYFITRQKNPFAYENELHYSFPLDIELMNMGAALLLEYKDFTSFSKLHTQVKTNNCRVDFALWECQGDNIVFTIKADRFLRNMVRAIVGSLLDLGRGKISVQDFKAIIEAKDRAKAGASAPPQALFLYDIQYPENYGVQNLRLSF